MAKPTAHYLESLPLDVHDRLLHHIPNRVTLLQTLLASRMLHEAFSHHTTSIVSSVAENEVGPAWPFALQFLRAESSPGPRLPPDGWSLIADPSMEIAAPHEQTKMLKMGRIALALENLFSLL